MIDEQGKNDLIERFDRLALLNRRLIAYGPAREAIAPATLAAAYGGQALWRGEDYALVMGDVGCCGEGEGPPETCGTGHHE